MKKFLLIILFLFVYSNITLAVGLPFGTPRVVWTFPCLNGTMIKIQPPIGSLILPGPYLVPPGSNRYLNFIYPPTPGTKMLGWWLPGGVCLIPGAFGLIAIPVIGTITGYGSALGF